MIFLYSQTNLHIILIIYHTKVFNSTVNTKKLGTCILSSVKIVQHLESVTILECAVVWVQMSMTSFSLQTASRNR